ncbi:pentapeptide repeat-containing protein [Paraburkholderia sediminicola]|uniref:pentapeptide repeat-containing protein n=1 Tax=Paraburkholderia sediminicola TaxID=458836 RepID=UPI0038B95BEC
MRVTQDEITFAQRHHVHLNGTVSLPGQEFSVSCVDGRTRFDTAGQNWTDWAKRVLIGRESALDVQERQKTVNQTRWPSSISTAGAVSSTEGHKNAVSAAAVPASDLHRASQAGANESSVWENGRHVDVNGNDVSETANNRRKTLQASAGDNGSAGMLRGEALQSFIDHAADCRRARFVSTDFTGISFENKDCRGATFTGCTFNQTGLSGANLQGASFRGARLIGFTAKDLELLAAKGANLSGVLIENSRIGETDCVLDVSNAQFVRCEFVNSTIGRWKLASAEFMACTFKGVNADHLQANDVVLENCRFERPCLFRDVDAPGAKFIGCVMVGFISRRSNFEGALVESCTTRGSILYGNWRGATFSRLNIYDEHGNPRDQAKEMMSGKVKAYRDYSVSLGDSDYTNVRIVDSNVDLMSMDLSVRIEGLSLQNCRTNGARFFREVMIDGELHRAGVGAYDPCRPSKGLPLLRERKLANSAPALSNDQISDVISQ